MVFHKYNFNHKEMRILIVGEFSGLGNAFIEGFKKENNNEVYHLSSSDGYKAIIDRPWFMKNRYIDYVLLIYQALILITKKYDLILWLSPFVFKYPLKLNILLNKLLIKKGNSNIYYSCTSDSVYWNNYPSNTDRFPLKGFLQDTNLIPHRYSKPKYYDYNIQFISMMNKVYCCSEEYYQVYNQIISTKIIRYPIIISNKFENKNELVNLFFHGVTRKGIKGTDEILNLAKKYSIDVTVKKQLKYSEFMNELNKTGIYLDQFNSHYPGMAALIALQKVYYVYTGYRSDLIKDQNYLKDCPLKDVRELKYYSKENLDLSQDRLMNNYKFLKKWHDPLKIVNELINDLNFSHE